jgi:argininosuccinate lyase
VLGVDYSIALRKAPGGPAPFATKLAIDERRKQLDTDAAFIDQKLEHLAKARESLITDARRLVA